MEGQKALKPSGIITLLSDFGLGSSYVGALYGVILTIGPNLRVVDLSHSIPPQDIAQGGILLYETAPLFPPGTVHIAVVDPGVGSDREILLAQIGNQYYIAPNNGLLARLIDNRACESDDFRCINLTNRQYWRSSISHTFHGRDIMAPVAAHLSIGVPFEDFGQPFSDLCPIKISKPTVSPKQILGIIERIDSFGNLITNIQSHWFEGRPTDERVHISGQNFHTWGIFDSYAFQPSGALIATVGSNGYLEIAVVNDSAAKRFRPAVGDPISLNWD